VCVFVAIVEFEAAHNLLVAIVLIESDKAVLDQILKSLVSEPAQKTNIKFKVYVTICGMECWKSSMVRMDRRSECLPVALSLYP
jgi:hypothetical protein